jgi:hypothetical protein
VSQSIEQGVCEYSRNRARLASSTFSDEGTGSIGPYQRVTNKAREQKSWILPEMAHWAVRRMRQQVLYKTGTTTDSNSKLRATGAKTRQPNVLGTPCQTG